MWEKQWSYKRTIEKFTNECHPLVFISSKASICSSEINHLMTMVSQQQQYFQSFALSQSYDRK